MKDIIFNTKEVALILNITAERVRDLCRERKLRFFRYQKRSDYRILASDLKEYLINSIQTKPGDKRFKLNK